MGRRTKARECALQILYQWDMTRERMDQVVETYWRLRSTTEETRARAERLAWGAHRKMEELDAAIAEAATNWRLERIAAVDKNILRVGAYELFHEPETPVSVVIDEAVEMAKRFGEADSPAFVNGLLDAIHRRIHPGAGAKPPKKKETV